MPEKYLCFSLEGSLFAVPVEYVQEIASTPDSIVPIPNTPEHIRGITKFRNQALMVIDLKKQLNICGTEECKKMIIINKGHNVGVLVDKVVGMILLEQEQIDKTLAIRAFLESSFIEGIAHPDNRLICVLSEKVFLENLAVEN